MKDMKNRWPLSLADRIAAKVVVQDDGCHIWTGKSERNGYGIVYDGQHQTGVHRVVYEMLNGPQPLSIDICHKCDVRRCCNPDHLFAGTRKDNMADCARKGRTDRTHKAKGEAHGMATLAPKDIAEIISKRESGLTLSLIAADHGVSIAHVHRIVKGKSWKHLQAAFSLIEAMIVVAIMAILFAIALPLYAGYVVKTQVGRVAAEVATLQTPFDACVVNGQLTPTTCDFGATGSTLQSAVGANTVAGGPPATGGAPVATMAADGSGTLVATFGGSASASLTAAGAKVTRSRDASGNWVCTIAGVPLSAVPPGCTLGSP